MASHTYNGVQNSNSGSTWTYTNAPIGTADATRLVVVEISARGAATSISSVTIGGNAATLVVGQGSGDGVFIYKLAVAAGTTATVVVNFGASNTGSIAVYSLYNLSSHTQSATMAVASESGTITVQAGGIVIATSHARGKASIAWTGVDVDASAFPGSGHSFASREYVSAA